MYVQFKQANSGVRVIEFHRTSKQDYCISMCLFVKGVTDVGYYM